ncbi:hypothetical protein SAMN04488026_11324 [Aliiruegeria lutimaris]|uniref:Uncharacterized protein n=1 Tax=Aliiruegeria lutimaris TaxID=571298 RepID=A0A1G9P0X7_9RHOB|nr:hypothetical protein SAMN04488026_11324 [Aliiruegeria lutimaris]
MTAIQTRIQPATMALRRKPGEVNLRIRFGAEGPAPDRVAPTGGRVGITLAVAAASCEGMSDPDMLSEFVICSFGVWVRSKSDGGQSSSSQHSDLGGFPTIPRVR